MLGVASFGKNCTASPKRGSPKKEQLTRRLALYCTPHVKVPGELVITPSHLVLFDPDHKHPHIQEFGAKQYEVCLEICDILECGAVAMPIHENGEEHIAFYLQLHVRTLDGTIRCRVEDSANTWCLVFRLWSREDLNASCEKVLMYLDTARSERVTSPTRSNTSIPFPCLNCAAEMEAAAMAHEKHELQSKQLRAFIAGEVEKTKAEKEKKNVTSKPAVVDDDSDEGLGIVLRPGQINNPFLTEALATAICEYLPVSLRIEGAVEWVLVYTPKAHGISLQTLYRNLGSYDRSLVLVQDADGHVFGGYAPNTWTPCGKFYGSGEAFVFSFGFLPINSKMPTPRPRAFTWTTANNYFMFSDDAGIGMGGENGRHAFFLSSDFLHGFSSPTATFGNDVLASGEEFVVKDIEIWAFVEL